jgi:TonB family protein
MFETSVVRAQTQAPRGRFGMLTVSIIAHTAVIVGAVAVSVASVEFPATAPDEYSMAPLFMPVQIPPPLGNPNAGAPRPAQAQPRPQPAQQQQPNQITAPSTVPETVTPIETSSTGAGDALASGTGTEPGPIGVPWGTENSVGELDAPPSPIVAQVPEPRVYQPHEVKAPVLRRRVEPAYPQAMVRAGVSATVVVRCIIDRNGHVKDPEVIVPAMQPFNAEVMRVITQWRFTPGSVNGQAVDSYFHLTVSFAVRR